MSITPDDIVFWKWGPVSLNATLLYTWLVMGLLVFGSWLVTRRLSSDIPISRRQNLLEVLISTVRDQIRKTFYEKADRYFPFIATLFLFIALSNVLAIVPGYHPPTGSLSTTTALALCVFVAVPLYGISRQGLVNYLKHYLYPTVFMLPFHIVGELSRTLALAVRLYGNIMAGTMVVAILLILTPLFLPIIMQALELLIGLIQAYIFAVLATVYIASATRVHEEKMQEFAQHKKGDT